MKGGFKLTLKCVMDKVMLEILNSQVYINE